MKKIVIVIFSLFSWYSVYATQSTITCPGTLTCDFYAGTCKLPTGSWLIRPWSTQKYFSTTNVASILGIKNVNTGRIDLTCSYASISGDNLIISIHVKKLTGTGWIYSGFGNSLATCQSGAAPTTCAAE